ncbi:hypothetical protein CHS0354_040705 [Potamilus streckersoni]|uniref:Uncharacterized protein n=1 Tax=Potamilus streckersoni TaxID=2493646 RepID=A0AAE0SLA5_9BIVA|nr:hypothetical protein CHS0354_040705 [Potamilus streckersoni]
MKTDRHTFESRFITMDRTKRKRVWREAKITFYQTGWDLLVSDRMGFTCIGQDEICLYRTGWDLLVSDRMRFACIGQDGICLYRTGWDLLAIQAK